MYVATGDTGKIFSVAPDGKGQVFYSSEKLIFDRSRSIPVGMCWREQSRAGGSAHSKAANNRHAFVLYETSKRKSRPCCRLPMGICRRRGWREDPASPGQTRPRLLT